MCIHIYIYIVESRPGLISRSLSLGGPCYQGPPMYDFSWNGFLWLTCIFPSFMRSSTSQPFEEAAGALYSVAYFRNSSDRIGGSRLVFNGKRAAHPPSKRSVPAQWNGRWFVKSWHCFGCQRGSRAHASQRQIGAMRQYLEQG